MIETLRITALVENTATGVGMLAEHGLAFWIEADDRRILFDTGQGLVLRHNAGKLGADLNSADAVVLSHGHFDHTGGLREVLQLGGRPAVYLHPAALAPKYARSKKPPHREIGIPDLSEATMRDLAREVVFTPNPTEIAPGLLLTGEVPRRNDFEDTGGPFYLDAQCTRPDPLIDDQALVARIPQGLVVILGCAHSGVVNTLDHVAELIPGQPILAVLGGMHLVRATQQRLETTAAALERHGVNMLAPGHCTGLAPTCFLRSRRPGRCAELSVGSAFAFGPPPTD